MDKLSKSSEKSVSSNDDDATKNNKNHNNNNAETTAASRQILSSPLPSELPDLEVADAMIAQEMANTSSQELERAYFDLHGVVSNEVLETPQLVDQCIQALQQEMECISKDDNKHTAFLQAKQQDEDYVRNRNLLLLFLRAEFFNVHAAALRLVRHFQVKLELFGPAKLTTDITQDDLDPETMDTLYSGLTQVLPSRDRSGRCICVYNANGQQGMSPLGKVRSSM